MPDQMRRRAFIAGAAAGTVGTSVVGARSAMTKLFLCGDVMLGRGIDQILPEPSDPLLYESYAKSALVYVELAERANGPIPRPSTYDYPWGEALAELDRAAPWARIVNLETAITTSSEREPKGINYRMHPANARAIAAAGINCCVLANNHVADWGEAGLRDTLAALQRLEIRVAGAGLDDEEAARPAALPLPDGGRVLVFGFGVPTSGVPRHWAANHGRPGVNFLRDLSDRSLAAVVKKIEAARRPGDLIVVSIHWGGNWGYEVSDEERRFAHRLVESGACDVLHGHSSHHPRPLEVYRDRLILYGCGDFLNDYEGISGYEQYRSEIVLMYLPLLDLDGRLLGLDLVPFRIRRFRLERASAEQREWLRTTLDRESRPFGCRVLPGAGGRLRAAWR